MKTQPRLNGKWTLICGIAIIVLVISIYYLTLPLDAKLRLFCTIDDAHLAQESPLWIRGYWRIEWTEWVDGYWTNPTTGANLTMITIWEAIDGGTWLYYDNAQNIFWITVQHGPMKNTTYGPYQGNLWTLTNTINPLATVGITLSIITLMYRPLSRLWTKKPHSLSRTRSG
jgi:hypothetical protein